MIKIIQSFAFVVLCIACTTKANDVGLEVLKDGISEIKKNNQSWALLLERNLTEGRSKSNLVIVDSAKALIYTRDAAIRNKITMNAYGAYLFKKYETCEIADSNRLAHAKTLLGIYNDKKDSLHYYQALLSFVMIERDLLEVCMMNTGAGDHKCMGFHIPIYSESDTVRVNTNFNFIACGFEQVRGSSVLKIHDKFQILLNGKNVATPIEYKIIGNAVVITITPTKSGEYLVIGWMAIFDQNLDCQASDSFRKSFYVIE